MTIKENGAVLEMPMYIDDTHPYRILDIHQNKLLKIKNKQIKLPEKSCFIIMQTYYNQPINIKLTLKTNDQNNAKTNN